MNNQAPVRPVKNPFLKINDVVYLYSGGRNRYIVTAIQPDGFEAVKEGSTRIFFHAWDDLKRWSNKKADTLQATLPDNDNGGYKASGISVNGKYKTGDMRTY